MRDARPKIDHAGPARNRLKREVDAARRAALVAGEILSRQFRERGFKVGAKGYDNPVTSADLAADRALHAALSTHYPDYGWLSEETVDDSERLRRSRVWIVDPLDGTKEFIKGVPEFVVAIALAEDGEPVLGVTYNPIREEMYWAARGLGCHLGDRRVHVSRRRTLARATVLASRSETARGEWEEFNRRLKVAPTGSVAYKLALVAAGKADATFTCTAKSEWDVASGAALIAEAGGRMTALDGSELRFNRRNVRLAGLIASNGLLHDELMRLIPQSALKPGLQGDA